MAGLSIRLREVSTPKKLDPEGARPFVGVLEHFLERLAALLRYLAAASPIEVGERHHPGGKGLERFGSDE
jgi:hypothetical protein